MARIRTIKPETFTDEKLVECSIVARFLFIGLWPFADDEGRMEYSPKRIKMQIFPADDINVMEPLRELLEQKVIRIYESDGQLYLCIPKFNKHQKINRPNQSRYPEPAERSKSLIPDNGERLRESDMKIHPSFSESEVNMQQPFTESEVKFIAGREGNGREKEKEKEESKALAQVIEETPVSKVFDSHLELIYQSYPRKVGKGEAKAAIKKALARLGKGEAIIPMPSIEQCAEWLQKRTAAYARSPAGQSGQYTPHPATWFNASRYLDEESEWYRNGDGRQPEPSKKQQRTFNNQKILAAEILGVDVGEDAGFGREDHRPGTDVGRGSGVVKGVLAGTTASD